VERANRSIKAALQMADIEGTDRKDYMRTYLQNYRATPHATTGKSPSELLHGRKMRTKLDAGVLVNSPPPQDDIVRQRVSERQAKQKGRQRFSEPRRIAMKTGPASYRLDDGTRVHAERLTRHTAQERQTRPAATHQEPTREEETAPQLDSDVEHATEEEAPETTDSLAGASASARESVVSDSDEPEDSDDESIGSNELPLHRAQGSPAQRGSPLRAADRGVVAESPGARWRPGGLQMPAERQGPVDGGVVVTRSGRVIRGPQRFTF